MTSQRCFGATVAFLAALALSTAVTLAQPTAPSATQLHAQMQAAMQRAGSVHIQERTATLPLGPHQTIRANLNGSADISSQQRLLRSTFNGVFTDVRSQKVVLRQREKVIEVDGTFARWTNDSPWSCQALLPQDLPQAYALTGPIHLPTTPQFISGVGAGSVDGTAVWRVTIALGDGKATLSIAQSDDRLVRVTEVSGARNAPDGITKTLTDFSRYGESVTAQLPQTCR